MDGRWLVSYGFVLLFCLSLSAACRLIQSREFHLISFSMLYRSIVRMFARSVCLNVVQCTGTLIVSLNYIYRDFERIRDRDVEHEAICNQDRFQCMQHECTAFNRNIS